MNIMKKLLILPFITLPLIAFGFNMAQFQQCQKLLKKCPMNGPFLNATCVNQTVNMTKPCIQLSKVSKATSVQANYIDAQAFGNLTLLTLHYPADGRQLYSVITADHAIVSLNVNPQQMDYALVKKYKNKLIFTTILGKPSYKKLSSGLQQFSVMARMTEKCVSCAVFGKINVDFNFNAQGKYLGVL